jgi:pimeloyl-ACP methyl ester carboxylesterase
MHTKALFSFFLVIQLVAAFVNKAYSQIDPLNSPYLQFGNYDVLSDSDMVASPAMYTYRPDASSGTTFPVFMFQLGANGFFSNAIDVHSYDIYLKHLASHGYVVVIVNDTQGGPANGNTYTTTYNWLMVKYNDVSHWMSQCADINKIVVGGHSNGGLNATEFMLNNAGIVKGIVYFASYPSTFFPTHNVSNYTGYVLSLAGSEDNLSSPNSCRDGYNKFTSATCRYFGLINDMHHGGFGDYDLASQPVGSIGRDSATATVRHLLVSFMNHTFKGDVSAENHLKDPLLRPGSISEFLTNCSLPTNPTSITKQDDISFSVIPNPASDFLQLNFSMGLKGNWVFTIIDLGGKQVYSEVLQKGITTKTISVSGFSSGFYMLHLFNEDGNIITEKIFVE